MFDVKLHFKLVNFFNRHGRFPNNLPRVVQPFTKFVSQSRTPHRFIVISLKDDFCLKIGKLEHRRNG